ncbi:MAG: cytochrome c biogenesis protein ResB [Eubacteriales bacterium]|nr:cytochrome c biogenesis protein ResB [Eubacteriales bacterium]
MKDLKKLGRFFCSMKFALGLLLVLAAVCTVGSLIPQKQAEMYYVNQYSEQAARAILLFGVDDLFHSWWFLVLTGLLCLNLILCNLVHVPKLRHRMKEGYSLARCLKRWDGQAVVTVKEDPSGLFRKMGFRRIEKETAEDGTEYLYAVRNKIGIWGAWLCHLGILILVVGFTLGQVLQIEHTVYGVPGQTKAVGDTGYELTIDSFDILLREDETVEQYQADLTMTDTSSGESRSGQASVNHPTSMFGWKCYQNSTGWAATVQVWKDGEMVQSQVLCTGEYIIVDGLDGVSLVFAAFYPDYARSETGESMTLSSRLNNPAYLYRLYYHEQVLGMNVLTGDDKITVEGYEIVFTEPQPYTLIQVKRDPYTGVAMLGGALILIALILAFYLRPEEVWARKEKDGRYGVAGYSRKGGQLFLDTLKEKGENYHG